MSPRISTGLNIKKRLAIFLFSAIAIYAVWNARNLIMGPVIEVIEPQVGATIDSKTLIVKGIIKNGSFISLDGRQIFTDKAGIFREEILPRLGVNAIEIRAEDRFGKEKIKRIEFYFEGEASKVASSDFILVEN
jgi:hypothetical protein